MTEYLIETLGVLAAIGLLGFLVVAGGRRMGMGRGRGPIELAGHLPLDARRAVYLVRVGEQVLVVGASEAGLTRLERPRRACCRRRHRAHCRLPSCFYGASVMVRMPAMA